MKLSHIDPKNDKNLGISSVFEGFMHFFQIFDGLCGLERQKCQQGKYVLSGMLIKEINAVFQSEIVRNRLRKRQKFENFFQVFLFLFTFCENIDRRRGLQC